jgi:DNA-directed RNA polymerase specialized sigma24 family protein
VAEILGLSVSAVKVRAHRGYKALRRNLEGDVAAGGAAVTSDDRRHKV